MPFEKQVCSVELSQELQKLGVKQASNFFWTLEKSGDDYVTRLRPKGWKVKWYENDRVSTFTVSELGLMLPSSLQIDGKIYFLTIPNGNGLKWIDYVTYSKESGVGTLLAGYPLIGGEIEADARAKLLIYLLENKLIEL